MLKLYVAIRYMSNSFIWRKIPFAVNIEVVFLHTNVPSFCLCNKSKCLMCKFLPLYSDRTKQRNLELCSPMLLKNDSNIVWRPSHLFPTQFMNCSCLISHRTYSVLYHIAFPSLTVTTPHFALEFIKLTYGLTIGCD